MAGLTDKGLEILKLAEVLSNIETSQQTEIDINITSRSDELLGQLNNIISLAIAEQWELAQAVYDSFNPLKAEGVQLDDIAAIIGIVRINETASKHDAQDFFGDHGTVIETTTYITNTATGDLFAPIEQTVITRTAAKSFKCSLDSVTPNTNYGFSVNGTAYIHDSGPGLNNTPSVVIEALRVLLAADAGTGNYTVVRDGDTLTVTTTADPIAFSAITDLNEVEYGTTVGTIAVEKGAIVAPAGAVDTIFSNVGGLYRTINTTDYTIGADTETDEEFRERIQVSQQGVGKATVSAIEDAVADVTGVTQASIVENRAITVVDGRPGKSFETIVQGGDNQNIAQTIWDTKPVGIETHGDIAVNVVDSSGDNQAINFSRPTAVNIAVRVLYDLYTEESYGGDTAAKPAMVTLTNTFGVGGDVIPTRYMGSVYNNTAGLSVTAVQVQTITNPGDAPVLGNWATTNIPISVTQFANITEADIYFEAN